MEHLTKQQIVLVTLLVSFVTALATGIVTVSLMNQAPASVGQSISRVIERTIEATTAPQSASVGNISLTEDRIAVAVEKVRSNTVQIKNKDNGINVGMGLIVSKDGVIVTDKSVVAEAREYLAVFSNGKQIPVVIVQSQINGDIVFLAPLSPDTSLSKSISPITFSQLPKLGQSVLALSGTSTPVLDQGIVNSITSSPDAGGTSSTIIHSSILQTRIMPGSPLFNVNGEVVGISLGSYAGNEKAEYLFINSLKSVIPVIKR